MSCSPIDNSAESTPAPVGNVVSVDCGGGGLDAAIAKFRAASYAPNGSTEDFLAYQAAVENLFGPLPAYCGDDWIADVVQYLHETFDTDDLIRLVVRHRIIADDRREIGDILERAVESQSQLLLGSEAARARAQRRGLRIFNACCGRHDR